MCIYKKMLSMLLVLCISMLIFPTQVFSKETQNENEFIFSDTYQNFIIPVYNGEENYGVYDISGNDVTVIFINDTLKLHTSKEYAEIIHYIKDNNLALARTDFIEDEKMNRATPIKSGWFSKEYRNYVDMRNSNGSLASDIEIGYTIRCRASCDYSSNIISYGTPELTKTFGKAGWFIDDVSTNAINKGKYIAINVSFTACWNINLIGGILSTTYRSINKVVRNETYCPL